MQKLIFGKLLVLQMLAPLAIVTIIKEEPKEIELKAEADLVTATNAAKGIEAKGKAEALATELSKKASVQDQVTLAKEVGENQPYQDFLIKQKQVEVQGEVMKAVGVAQAQNLSGADIKIFANAGSVSEGVGKASGIFNPGTAFDVASMIEAFKSTLEEISLADVVLHVVDGSSPEYMEHIQVVNSILTELNAGDKPQVLVLNKADACPTDGLPASLPGADRIVKISAKTGAGFDQLIQAIGDVAPGRKQKFTLLIPYADGSVLSELHENHPILKEEFEPEGTVLEVLLDAKDYNRFKKYAQG